MDQRSIVKGVSTSLLFILAKGQNSSLSIPLLGEYSTPIAGFVHGYVNSMLTDALWQPIQTLLNDQFKDGGLPAVRAYRLAHIGTAAIGQSALLYGTGDEGTGLIVGALQDMMIL